MGMGGSSREEERGTQNVEDLFKFVYIGDFLPSPHKFISTVYCGLSVYLVLSKIFVSVLGWDLGPTDVFTNSSTEPASADWRNSNPI